MDAIAAASPCKIDEDDPNSKYVEIRVGFHSGPVVADVVGTRNPRQGCRVCAAWFFSIIANMLRHTDFASLVTRSMSPAVWNQGMYNLQRRFLVRSLKGKTDHSQMLLQMQFAARKNTLLQVLSRAAGDSMSFNAFSLSRQNQRQGKIEPFRYIQRVDRTTH